MKAAAAYTSASTALNQKLSVKVNVSAPIAALARIALLFVAEMSSLESVIVYALKV